MPKNLINKIFDSKISNNIEFIEKDIVYIGKVKKLIIEDGKNNIKKLSLLNELRSSFGEALIINKKINTNDNLIQALVESY